jgi:hypothetical protein
MMMNRSVFMMARALPRRRHAPQGFVLVISLLMMVLLTIVAVGLLTLSSISLSGSAREADMQAARDSARMALMLAINQLQGHAGADRRITVTAGQIPADPADGSQAKAPPEHRNWAAVYDSWPAGVNARPSPAFRSWLVSGSHSDLARRDFATTSGSGRVVEIVGKGTVGDTRPELRVEVPLMEQALGGKGKVRIGWWVGDEGVKAYVPSEPSAPANGSSSGRIAMQAAPNYGLEVMAVGNTRPFAAFDHDSEDNRKLVSWGQTSLVTGSPAEARPLFHDLSTHNRGLITNVRTGGFRRDLSMFLQSSTPPRTTLYNVGGRGGINMAELWAYHNLPSQLQSGGGGKYSTGGNVPSDALYLKAPATSSAFNTDKFHFQKQPVYIRFQTVLSFSSVPVQGSPVDNPSYRLGIVVDPIVTLWNPLDVPLVLTGSWNSVKYWPIPYDIVINANGSEFRVPYRFIVGTSGVPQYLTMRTGTDPLVLKPGEVMVYSQGENTPTVYSSGKLQFINGKPGWNFGGGMFYDFKNNDPAAINKNPLVVGPGATSFTYRVEPNATVSLGSEHWALNTHGIYYKEDRSDSIPRTPDAAPGGSTESVNLGDYSIDSRSGQPFDSGPAKPDKLRIRANDPKFREFFDRIGAGGGSIALEEVSSTIGNKRQFMVFTFAVKTETGADNPGRYFARYNPRATRMDFFDIEPNEIRTLPFEVQISRPQAGFDPVIDVSSDGSAYFGGGWTIRHGTKTVITHSVPRHPPVSLAAFQHSMANGFVPDSNGRIDTRVSLLPQISHAIGNSLAPSILAPEATEGALGGPRPIADHSYLANQALWDDWFLSGISPQTTKVFATTRNQRTVAQDFLNGGKPLPVRQYKANLRGQESSAFLGKWFSGNNPRAGSEALTASALTVEGMFNVNSTSVEAWKSLLSTLRNRTITGQSPTGGDAGINPNGGTPNASLLAPLDQTVDANATEDRRSPAQWSGVRVLTDDEIAALAEAIVIEVRKRGPFLSLADFINRRVGTDKQLALSGAIQSALDAGSVPINQKLRTGDRATTGSEDGLAFPEAERGAAAYGIPGYVKQADILTPIAPLLSVRSDTFVVRGYGEKLDSTGRVTARAWCEAVVIRGADFVDKSDDATKLPSELKPVNQAFGRRFDIVSFRWLSPSEV